MKYRIGLKKSPIVARQLVEYGRLKNIIIPHEVMSLAQEDLVDQNVLVHAGVEPTELNLRVLQRVLDSKGRHIICGPPRGVGALLALIGAIQQGRKVLILSDESEVNHWMECASQLMPDLPTHYVAKNTRSNVPKHSVKPDKDAAITISTLQHMTDHGLFIDFRAHQIILGERKHFLRTSDQLIQQLHQIIPSVVMLYYKDAYKKDNGDLYSIVMELYRAHSDESFKKVFLMSPSSTMSKKSGYRSNDNELLLSLIGVSLMQ